MTGLPFVLCLFVATSPTLGQDRIGPPQPSDAGADPLGGRLTVGLPKGYSLSGSWNDIMGAGPVDTKLTRVQLEAGPQRMVIVAYELFARAGDDFAAAVRQQTAKLPAKITVEELAEPSVPPWICVLPNSAHRRSKREFNHGPLRCPS